MGVKMGYGTTYTKRHKIISLLGSNTETKSNSWTFWIYVSHSISVTRAKRHYKAKRSPFGYKTWICRVDLERQMFSVLGRGGGTLSCESDYSWKVRVVLKILALSVVYSEGRRFLVWRISRKRPVWSHARGEGSGQSSSRGGGRGGRGDVMSGRVGGAVESSCMS